MLTNQSIGYMDAPVPKDLDLKEAIDKLRKEKNAIILAHYYQTGDIQDIADYVGDSLALAQWAAKTKADIIVLCGVHFMGETAKILCPDKKVLVPDLNAGCSLADSCPATEFAEFVKQHPGHTVISYVNTTAAVKAVTDVVVTSTNARQIVESFPEGHQCSDFLHLPPNSLFQRSVFVRQTNPPYRRCSRKEPSTAAPLLEAV